MPIKRDDTHQVNEKMCWFQKWWPENVPKNVTFKEITINDMLDEQVEKYRDDNFVYFLDTWMTYGEFHRHVLALATALFDLGVKKGDVIAFHLPNCVQYIISYFATAKIGAIASGINPTYQSMEILHQLDIIKPKVLIAQDHLYEEYIKPIIARSSIEKLIYTNIADMAQGLGFKKIIGKILKKIPKGKVDRPGAINFVDLLETPPNVPKVDIDVKTDPATYIMTGGTTGLPKAAVLTHFNVVSNAKQCMYWLGGEKPGIGTVGILPLFHSFAHTVIMNAIIAIGGWIMLFPKPPTVEDLCKHVEKIPCPEGLIYAGAEILFKNLADYKGLRIRFPDVMRKLILCVSGAGPLHKTVREAFIKNTGVNIVEGYGLTEASPVVSAGNLFGKSPMGVIGIPLPGTKWGIWPIEDFYNGPICLGKPDDTNFGEEHTGEICVCGPQIMLEYLNKPEETNETIKEYKNQFWLLTGDIGFMNKDGTIAIRDRKKQLIKYKGYSVYPKEVEELLMKHPDISEVAVAGIPHDEFGEVVKAWVKIGRSSNLMSNAIKTWAEKNMTHYKRPYYVEIIKELPKNMIGKVQRRILQINDPIWKAKHRDTQ